VLQAVVGCELADGLLTIQFGCMLSLLWFGKLV